MALGVKTCTLLTMGWRDRARRGVARFLSASGLTFSSSTPRPIDQVIFEMNSVSGRTIDRNSAMTVAGVQKGRNMICAVATLPIIQTTRANKKIDNPLFRQVDPDVANVVTMAQTVEDLLFYATSWWEITAWDFDDFPTSARHLDWTSVSLTPPNDRSLAPLPSGEDPRRAVIYVDGREVAASRVIRFDSPNAGILVGGGAKAIRRALLIDATQTLYLDNPRPLDYFTPAEGADEVPDPEVNKILARWRDARRKRATGWIPRSMEYHTVDAPTPQQMQLAELSKAVQLELANLFGVDPEDLGISTTSRTYANANDRRQDRVNDVLSMYMRAITDRLSMDDVTRPGNIVRFDLSDYMKANPVERAEIDKAYHDMGVVTDDEIRDRSLNLPPLTDAQRATMKPAPAPAPATPAESAPDEPGDMMPEGTMQNRATPAALQLDATDTAAPGMRRVEFAATNLDFRVERESRTIWGMALPYNQIVTKWGLRFRFMPGSIEWSSQVSRHKMLRDHEFGRAIGYALDLTQSKRGVIGKYKLGRSTEADAALIDAEDGVADGLSMSVEFDLEADARYNRNDDVYDVYRAFASETSLTAMPAFDDARVTKVAASKTQGGSAMHCAACGQEHAPGVACASRPPENTPAPAPANQPPAQPAGLQLNDDQLGALLRNPAALAAMIGVPQQQAAPNQAFTLSNEQISALAAGGHLRTLLGGMLGAPAALPAGNAQGGDGEEQGGQRHVVDPTRRPVAVTATREEMPYRFDRKGNLTRGQKYDFSTDLIQGLRDGNGEALKRAEGFVRAQFDTDMADAAALNPNRQRPDLYVDQREYAYPIWNAINKGAIQDATPFVLPKFSSSSGLVAAHTEGVEPTAGVFTATSQTITPSAVSGKVSITREAWDQGGNPQLSGLIWNQMLRAWFEALEASAVTLLNGLSVTDILLTAGAVDSALVSQLELELAKLQYVRGGFRMRDFPIQVDLYSALIDATDGDGRKLLPIIGATNANGQTSDFFGDVLIAGLRGTPAWALAATGSVAAKSYLFDRGDVSGWATAPNRLTFENVEVRYVHVGIWGYKALACTDTTGVRTVTYDPVP